MGRESVCMYSHEARLWFFLHDLAIALAIYTIGKERAKKQKKAKKYDLSRSVSGQFYGRAASLDQNNKLLQGEKEREKRV